MIVRRDFGGPSISSQTSSGGGHQRVKVGLLSVQFNATLAVRKLMHGEMTIEETIAMLMNSSATEIRLFANELAKRSSDVKLKNDLAKSIRESLDGQELDILNALNATIEKLEFQGVAEGLAIGYLEYEAKKLTTEVESMLVTFQTDYQRTTLAAAITTMLGLGLCEDSGRIKTMQAIAEGLIRGDMKSALQLIN